MTPRIGLECHVQLATSRKLFCDCETARDAERTTCPICLGHPGTLPVLGAEAITLAVRAALALGAEIQPLSRFERKHYFHPDLPRGFQITQRSHPVARGGALDTPRGRFALLQIQIEEDTAQTRRGEIDWRRAGTPLIEVVGAPDMTAPEQAGEWLRMLRRVLVTAGVTGGAMERGQLRCDANVSLDGPDGAGTRVELKNLNAIRGLERAIAGEISRQRRVLERGGRVAAHTRGWTGRESRFLRGKEQTPEYRFLPEPDLPAVPIDPEMIEAQRRALPATPLAPWLLARDAEPPPQRPLQRSAPAIWLDSEEARLRNRSRARSRLLPEHRADLERLLEADTIDRRQARRMLEICWARGISVAEQLRRIPPRQSVEQITAVVTKIVGGYPRQVARYQRGNQGMIGFFMGRVMAALSNADPGTVNRIVRDVLERA